MPDLISTTQAAAICGVSEVSLHKWRRKGTGPTVYPSDSGKRFQYDRAECQRFARERDRFHQLENRIRDLEAAVVALAER